MQGREQMVSYHATTDPHLDINPFHNSRYAFPALFTTTEIKLAKVYRDFNSWKHGSGFLYKVTHTRPSYSYDFHNKVTYNMSFRNLIYELRHRPVRVAKIKNCLDTPHNGFHHHIHADIIVILDLENIHVEII